MTSILTRGRIGDCNVHILYLCSIQSLLLLVRFGYGAFWRALSTVAINTYLKPDLGRICSRNTHTVKEKHTLNTSKPGGRSCIEAVWGNRSGLTGMDGLVIVGGFHIGRTGGILRNPSRPLEETSEDEARRRMSTLTASQEHTHRR